jgi:hypothetical protein
MAEPLDFRIKRTTAPGEDYYRRQGQAMELNASIAEQPSNPLDDEPARKVHRRLLEWYWHERDRQAANRLEMAMDSDFYDNLQWDPQDAAELQSRGQMPLVYNEVAPMVDWIIGTERRARVDWRVLPRTEDDVQMADVKTKVLKYTADVNRVQFQRSRAFSDAVKVGVGWLDDGVRDDPTQDILYSKYEDWRQVLWDSSSYDLDLSDARYVFRWRWVDEDIAAEMFPLRANKIRESVEDVQNSTFDEYEEEVWWHPEDRSRLLGTESTHVGRFGAASVGEAKRRRVKLIEAQYRMPVKARLVNSGPLRGSFFDERDQALMGALNRVGGSIVEKLVMRVHVAVFTETDMLAMAPSIFRHNRFTLTPVWCYRRGSDRLPYGVIRRVRDIQQDLNKRASKALFMLNTNQIIADEGAVADWDVAREEVSRPDGVIIKKPAKEFLIRRDTDAATGQISMMTLAAQSIQKSAGVSEENMGRRTNAVSGEAIKARQLQGSVVTTEPFDNLRFAVQVQGEKQLALAEQFYTEEKVVRLTGAKGALEWVKVNQPEVQPDGTVRFINDITASMADFMVADADYAGTLRQVMFESLNEIAMRLPPEVALRLLAMAMDYSDLPNKDEIAREIRQVTGQPDPSAEPTPEEVEQLAQQQQMQVEALQMQREQAMLALEEARAKVRELNARAAKLEAEAGIESPDGQTQAVIDQVRSQAAQEIDRLSEALRKANAELASRTIQANQAADVAIEKASIDAASRERVAEIQAASNRQIDALSKRLQMLEQQMRAGAP